jgi:hypothetical protein
LGDVWAKLGKMFGQNWAKCLDKIGQNVWTKLGKMFGHTGRQTLM